MEKYDPFCYYILIFHLFKIISIFLQNARWWQLDISLTKCLPRRFFRGFQTSNKITWSQVSTVSRIVNFFKATRCHSRYSNAGFMYRCKRISLVNFPHFVSFMALFRRSKMLYVPLIVLHSVLYNFIWSWTIFYVSLIFVPIQDHKN